MRGLGTGWDLREYRHSSLTHLGEQGASLLMLMAKSRHKKPENLRRYFKPSLEADLCAVVVRRSPDRDGRFRGRSEAMIDSSVTSPRERSDRPRTRYKPQAKPGCTRGGGSPVGRVRPAYAAHHPDGRVGNMR